MARELLLELLLAAAARPHRQCLQHTRTLQQQRQQRGVRCASTSTNRPSRPRPSSSSRAVPPATAAAAKVPLHVGLDRNPENVSAISRIPIPRGVKAENFTPSVLARPLGLPYPPQAGQHSPIDKRTFTQKKSDLSDYDKTQENRRRYIRTFFRPYFQEWKRFNYHKGKSFVSNERLFKRDKALYFPNIWGQTLSEEGDGPDGGRDTADVLAGKISVVRMFSNQWSEEQVNSFVAPDKNPELQDILDRAGTDVAQRVDVNMQGDFARLMLVKLFKSGIRNQIPQDRWDRYFMVKLPRDVRRGLTDEIRDAMGLLNTEVGYVYLVDPECRIRWAGSGDAWDGEIKSLNAGLKRLVQEASIVKQAIAQ